MGFWPRNRSQQGVRGCRDWKARKKRVNWAVQNNLQGKKNEKELPQIEYPAWTVPWPRGRRYDNEILMKQFAEPEGPPMFAHHGDWPACHAEIFSVLHKKKIAAGKKLQKIAFL